MEGGVLGTPCIPSWGYKRQDIFLCPGIICGGGWQQQPCFSLDLDNIPLPLTMGSLANKGRCRKNISPWKLQNRNEPLYRDACNSHLIHTKITCFENVKYFLDLSNRNVFTRNMRDFSVADQGKMAADNKCRKCPNSELILNGVSNYLGIQSIIHI